MRELEIVRQVRSSLLKEGLAGQRVIDLYTDAHPTLRVDPALQPFQRFALLLGGLTVHPDLGRVLWKIGLFHLSALKWLARTMARQPAGCSYGLLRASSMALLSLLCGQNSARRSANGHH